MDVNSYWQVYCDANRLIRESFSEAGFPAAAPAYTVSGVWSGPFDQVQH
jgi:hypothetical protein